MDEDEIFNDDDGDDDGDPFDELDMDCGLADDGQCSQAGTEYCDFQCPYRDSDLFAGSAAWQEKHKSK